MQKKPLILCLMGPTATGKTDIAVELVQQLPCDIISVDSAMVYRGMDIGTAKPSKEILAIAPHRLLDIRDPSETYSAGDFCKDALHEIKNIAQNNRIPLLVGGTMLYFNALQNGMAELPKANAAIRIQLEQEIKTHGLHTLHQRLAKIDPVAAQRIHPNDPQRIQRALEVYELTGKSLTEFLAATHSAADQYQFINIALMPADRSLLHEKIALRFQQMLQQGLIEEVKKLFSRGDLHANLPAIRAVGYRQVWDYLAGSLTDDEMCERAVIATRQLAKRQMTWLRSWEDLQVFGSEDVKRLDKILEFIRKMIG
jgi:tRNA dimethylallyltransferase